MTAVPITPPAALSPAHAAITTRRHAWNWRLAWRLFLRLALVAAGLPSVVASADDVAAWQWAVGLAGCAVFVLLPALRVLAGRRDVRLPLKVRGAHTPLSWFATMWWTLPLYLIGREGHTNQGATRGDSQSWWLDVAVVVVVPVVVLLVRHRTVVVATEEGISWRTPVMGFADGEFPDAEVMPLSISDFQRFANLALWIGAVTVCIAEGRWYLSAGLIAGSLVVGVVQMLLPLARGEARWSDVAVVAAEAGNRPVITVGRAGTLDIGPLLAAGTSGDRLLSAVLHHGSARPNRVELEADRVRDEFARIAATDRPVAARPITPGVFRPAVRATLPGWRIGGGAGAATALVLGATSYVRLSRDGASTPLLLTIIVLTVLACLAAAAAILASARLTVGDDQVRSRLALRTRSVAASAVRAVCVTPVLHGAYGPEDASTLRTEALLLGDGGVPLLRLAYADAWGAAQLAEIADALGVPLHERSKPITPEQLAGAFGTVGYRGPVPPYYVAMWSVVAIVAAAVTIAAVQTGVVQEVLGDQFDVDRTRSPEQRARAALRDRVQAVLPKQVGAGDDARVDLSCVDDGLDTCPISPQLRRIVEQGSTPLEQASILCRCDPERVSTVVAHGEEPLDEPGVDGTSVSITMPDYDAEPAVFTKVHLIYDADGSTVTDVRCTDDDREPEEDGLLAAAEAGPVDPTSVRCDGRDAP